MRTNTPYLFSLCWNIFLAILSFPLDSIMLPLWLICIRLHPPIAWFVLTAIHAKSVTTASTHRMAKLPKADVTYQTEILKCNDEHDEIWTLLHGNTESTHSVPFFMFIYIHGVTRSVHILCHYKVQDSGKSPLFSLHTTVCSCSRLLN